MPRFRQRKQHNGIRSTRDFVEGCRVLLVRIARRERDDVNQRECEAASDGTKHCASERVFYRFILGGECEQPNAKHYGKKSNRLQNLRRMPDASAQSISGLPPAVEEDSGHECERTPHYEPGAQRRFHSPEPNAVVRNTHAIS